MKEILIVCFIIGFYLFVSYKVHRILLNSRIVVFVFVTIVYLIGTYYLFAGFTYFVDYLATRKIYLEFGHGNLLIIEVLLVCFLIALINIIWIVILRINKQK